MMQSKPPFFEVRPIELKGGEIKWLPYRLLVNMAHIEYVERSCGDGGYAVLRFRGGQDAIYISEMDYATIKAIYT